MKRLSVRLSVIGAVLVLGGAAIAYQMLTGRGSQEPEPGETAPSEVAQAEPTDTEGAPTPIRVAGNTGGELSPATIDESPTSAFPRENSLRSVHFQSTADDTDGTETATPIATTGPVGSGGGFPLPTHSGDVDSGLSEAVADSASEDFSAPPTTTPPPEPGYGVPADPTASSDGAVHDSTRVDDPETADSSGSSSGLSGLPPAPSTSFPVDPSVSGNAAPPTSPAGDDSLASGDSATSADRSLAVDGSPPPDEGLSGSTPAGTPPVDTSTSAGLAGTFSPGGYAGASSDPSSTAGAAVISPGTDASAGGPAAADLAVGGDAYPGDGAIATSAGDPSSLASGSTESPAMSSNTSAPPSADAKRSEMSSYASGVNQPGQSAAVVAQGTTEAAERNLGQPTSAPHSSYGTRTVSPVASGGSLEAQSVPGDRQLEGQQAPAIVIEKLAPAEIQVNRETTFQVRVQNRGTTPAHNVTVVDRVPEGTRFESATPAVQPAADGTLVWQVNTIAPGEEVMLSINLTPQVAGEIGSVAQATFQTVASVRTVCTQPELKLEVQAPQSVLIGQSATLEIKITNVGSGAAEDIVVEEDVPEGFAHAAGRELEHQIQVLRPQESRSLTLPLRSVQPGVFENRMLVRAAGDVFVEDRRQIEVTAPQLQVAMQGPSLRYLDRQATYTIQLANPGTAGARSVELATHLPRGMKYVTSDKHGQYDSQSHAVYWSLEELPPSKQGDVSVTVLPIEPGSQKLMTDVRAELGLKESCEHEVIVEGLAELSFVISDVADPIEVGSNTTYEVRVHNRGSKPDTQIQLVAELPQGLVPTTGDGPTKAEVQGQSVYFDPLERLGPGEEAIYKIHARGGDVGDHVISAQLRSTELRVPVTKEEITRVYTDR